MERSASWLVNGLTRVELIAKYRGGFYAVVQFDQCPGVGQVVSEFQLLMRNLGAFCVASS
jgi:hypothetical protein